MADARLPTTPTAGSPGSADLSYRLAPWVVPAVQGADIHLLGPGLALVRVGAGTVTAGRAAVSRAVAEAMGPEQAVSAGWLEPTGPGHAGALPPGDAREMTGTEEGTPVPGAGPSPERVAGVVLRDDAVPAGVCASFCRRLAAAGAGRWITLRAGQPLPHTGPPPYVLPVAHRTSELPPSPPYADAAAVLHLGEAFEGTYVTGPGGRGPGACPGTRWAFEARLDSLGFAARPLPFVHRLRTDPDGLVRAVLTALALGPDEAVLVHEGRTVAFCTPGAVGTAPFGHISDGQAWTFGMVRGLTVRPGTVPGSHVATCRTPAAGQDHLEGNSGKGMSAEAAARGAVGEALERYAAYEANRSLPPAPGAVRRLGLAGFHPYGPAWERHRAAGERPVRYAEGVDLADGSAIAVPKALVVFPCTDPDRPTDGTTTGLAAGPDTGTAALRGLREVLERHRLYGSFTRLRPAVRLDHTPALARLGLDGAFRGEVWALHWPDPNVPLPDVHAFHHDPRIGTLVRASGSGLTFEEALDSAVTELCQVHFEAVRAHGAGRPAGPAHAAWARPDVVEEARGYLDAQPYAQPYPIPYTTEDEQFTRLVGLLAERGTAPVAVRLPLRGPDWTVVRVLVPGATTSTYPSDSRGGRRLLGARWTYGIPT